MQEKEWRRRINVSWTLCFSKKGLPSQTINACQSFRHFSQFFQSCEFAYGDGADPVPEQRHPNGTSASGIPASMVNSVIAATLARRWSKESAKMIVSPFG